jgi:plastocyanin
VRRSMIVIAMLSTVWLTACTSVESGPQVTEPPGPHLTLVAKDYAFQPTELATTANAPTLIYFTNQDGEQHGLAIYPNKESSDALFKGQAIGRGSTVYEVPPLAAGSYSFKCTIHPVMNGNLQVNP